MTQLRLVTGMLTIPEADLHRSDKTPSWAHKKYKNKALRLKWLQKAAEQNHPMAKALLRQKAHFAFQKPMSDHIKKPIKNKNDLEVGFENPERLFALAISTYEMQTEDKSYTKDLFQAAAKKGPVGALFNLGQMLFEGDGVPGNGALGATYIAQAAGQGYPPAQYKLGLMYEKGLGLAKDIDSALKWYKKAAEGEILIL
jgi:TPR repeat protein